MLNLLNKNLWKCIFAFGALPSVLSRWGNATHKSTLQKVTRECFLIGQCMANGMNEKFEPETDMGMPPLPPIDPPEPEVY